MHNAAAENTRGEAGTVRPPPASSPSSGQTKRSSLVVTRPRSFFLSRRTHPTPHSLALTRGGTSRKSDSAAATDHSLGSAVWRKTRQAAALLSRPLICGPPSEDPPLRRATITGVRDFGTRPNPGSGCELCVTG